MGPMWTRGVSATGGLRQSLPNFPRGIVPKFPVECSPSEYIAWERRFEAFIADQGLRHTISPDAPEIAVISCTNNAYLFGQFGEDLVTNHRRVWGYISDVTAGATFEDRLYRCHSISEALRIMREWSLPLHPVERHLLVTELEGVQFMGDEDPKFFSARTSHLETTMRAVGIEKDASEIVQFVLRQFPERPSNPHALVVGRGFRNGGAVGVGVRRRDDHIVSRGGGMRRQQQQLQQHWPRDGGMPGSSSCSNTDLATVACRGSSSCSSTGFAVVACRSSNSSCNTGLATVACRGSSSRSSNGLAVAACRGSSSNSSNGLAAVGFLPSTSVGPMLPLSPGRRDNSNRCSNRHESLRSEVTGRTEVAPYPKLFLAVMAGLFRSGFRRKLWRCRCSLC